MPGGAKEVAGTVEVLLGNRQRCPENRVTARVTHGAAAPAEGEEAAPPASPEELAEMQRFFSRIRAERKALIAGDRYRLQQAENLSGPKTAPRSRPTRSRSAVGG